MQRGLSTIAARFIKPFMELDEARLSGLGLERIDFTDPEARVDFAVAGRVFEVAQQVLGRDDLGVLGAVRHAGTLRILEYLSRVSRTPLDALEKVARYQNLIHDACVFELERTPGRVVAHIASRSDVVQPAVVVDFFMASLVLGLARLGTPLAGAHVAFVHGPPRDRSQFDAVFGCEIRFGAERNCASFPVAALTLPLADADPALCAMLEVHAQRMLARVPADPGLLAQLRAFIARNLSEGDLSSATAAEHLALSERTLRRRLQAHGTTFQALLDDVRAEVAADYLATTDLSIEEMAFLLGYSEASALRRAYRRWHGRGLPARPLFE